MLCLTGKLTWWDYSRMANLTATTAKRPSFSARTRARLNDERDLIPQCSCGSSDWQLSYQKCRFCGRGWPELKHLNKYAVRHYICDDCLAEARK
jgi:hypothetical protein